MENEKRLIDYQKAREIVLNELKGKITTVTAVMLATKMKYATVDAVEVVHGRWIEVRGRYTCSKCNEKALLHWGGIGTCVSNYCPNCGAKMDGGNEDGN